MSLIKELDYRDSSQILLAASRLVLVQIHLSTPLVGVDSSSNIESVHLMSVAAFLDLMFCEKVIHGGH